MNAPKVTVSGAKNPELIPEYVAWISAFHNMCASQTDNTATCASLDTDLPSVIVHANPTKEEDILLHKEADQAVKAEAVCWTRQKEAWAPLIKLQQQSGTTKDEWMKLATTLDAKKWDTELACRWETLRTRDRLLEALRPEVAAALRQVVEEGKRGMTCTFTDSKEGWSRFRQPQ